MTGLKCLSGVVALFALTLGAVELETAGELLVDLDASTLTGYEEGNNVELWPNAGTMPDFAHVNTHNKDTRPTYRIRNAAPAVRFAGSASGSMTNGVPTPDSLAGNNPWTVEAWIAPTQDQSTRYFLSFSTYYKVSDAAAEALTRAAFRIDNSNAAVDHNTYNLYWGRSNQGEYRPQPNNWYHICLVHEASGYERVYLNGCLTSVGNTIANVQTLGTAQPGGRRRPATTVAAAGCGRARVRPACRRRTSVGRAAPQPWFLPAPVRYPALAG